MGSGRALTVLVTRPEPEARRTAERLRALGHDPVLLPLTELRPTDAPVPTGHYDAVAATSANALRHARASDLAPFLSLPAWCVGEKTAAAATTAGFSSVHAGAGTAAALAEAMLNGSPSPRSVLYLCGANRLSDIELRLREQGVAVTPWVTYEAAEVSHLTGKMLAILPQSRPDAMLLFSARAAMLAGSAANDPAVSQLLEDTRFLCMSEAVAEALPAQLKLRATASDVPTERALLALLGSMI